MLFKIRGVSGTMWLCPSKNHAGSNRLSVLSQRGPPQTFPGFSVFVRAFPGFSLQLPPFFLFFVSPGIFPGCPGSEEMPPGLSVD